MANNLEAMATKPKKCIRDNNTQSQRHQHTVSTGSVDTNKQSLLDLLHMVYTIANS